MESVVYRVAPQSVQDSLRVLRRAGLHPRTIGDRDPSGQLSYVSKWTYRVQIAVPEEEVAAARDVLREWEAQHAAGVSSATTAFRRQLLVAVSIGIGAALLLAWHWWPTSDESAGDG